MKVGDILKQTAASFFIRQGSCSSCEQLQQELNNAGPDKIEANLDEYSEKLRVSMKMWSREKGVPFPTPPKRISDQILLYCCKKARESEPAPVSPS